MTTHASAASPVAGPGPTEVATPTLDGLRQSIDRIDDTIHDLLMQRMELVQTIGAAKAGTQGPVMRPGREAAILRRLAARHRGALPFGAVIRIWREIVAAATALQQPLSIAVHAPEDQPGPWDLARDQFGSQLPMAPLRSPAQVIRAVVEGTATLGVLALPLEDDPDPWWPLLASNDPHAPRILLRLPALRLAAAGRGNAPGNAAGNAAGNARGAERDALVIACQKLDPDSLERVYLALEVPPDISRARLFAGFASVGLHCAWLTMRETGAPPLALAEFEGPLALDDPRLAQLSAQLAEPLDRIYHIGGHPAPLDAVPAPAPLRQD